MDEKTKLTTMVMVIPFVISACVEFFPAWLYWPVAVLGGMIWIGALGRMGDM
jgi:hypothetical protein